MPPRRAPKNLNPNKIQIENLQHEDLGNGGAQGIPAAPHMIDAKRLLQAFEGFVQLQQQALQQEQQLQVAPCIEAPRLDQFLCLSPPCFRRGNDLEVVDFCISEIEKKFQAMWCLEEEKVNLAVYML